MRFGVLLLFTIVAFILLVLPDQGASAKKGKKTSDTKDPSDHKTRDRGKNEDSDEKEEEDDDDDDDDVIGNKTISCYSCEGFKECTEPTCNGTKCFRYRKKVNENEKFFYGCDLNQCPVNSTECYMCAEDLCNHAATVVSKITLLLVAPIFLTWLNWN